MKLKPTEKHNRTLLAVELPTKMKFDLSQVEFYINYTLEENEGGACHKAIALDDHVVPQIVRAVNMHEQLVEAVKHLERILSGKPYDRDEQEFLQQARALIQEAKARLK